MSPDARQKLLIGLIALGLTEEIQHALGEADVPFAVLKGVALHLTGARGPAERPVSDVDVLVAATDLPRAERALTRIGFKTWAEAPWARSMGRADTPLPIDLHHRLFPPGPFRLSTRAALGRRVVAAPGLSVLCPRDQYAHFVGHFAKSRMGARDATHLDDFAAVARAARLAPAPLAAHLDRCGLGRAARYALDLAREERGDAHAGFVRAALAPDPIGDTLVRGIRRGLRRPAASGPPAGERSAVRGALLAAGLAASLPP